MDKIRELLKESIDVKERALNDDDFIGKVEEIAELLISSLNKNKKVILFGNGGSAADAQHIAAELVVRFEKDRKGLPAIALTTDTSALTACGNDYGFDRIFERQVEALANEGDCVIGISTSGKSESVNKGLEKAKELGAKTIAFTGRDGGRIKDLADISLIVPAHNTARIQEVHITVAHIICKLVEEGA